MPAVLIAAFAAATATLHVESVVRSGCGDDENKVAVLPAGSSVEIRSALSGGSGTCYKVVAELEGKQISGYVPAKSVQSAQSFDEARRSAKDLGSAGGASAAREVKAVVQQAAAKAGREHPASKAWQLIEANQPAEALRLLEKDLQKYPSDAFLHAVAGMAYYRMDNLDRALLHWKDSLAIESNPAIQAMVRRAEREKGADKGSERMIGNRVVLRYEKSTLSEPLAQAMLQVLDEEYTRVSFQLGCRASEKVTAVAQSRESYMQSTQAAEWSGGLYDGRIHVPVADSRSVSPNLRTTFAHELVHACLHELGSWPSWLHEGMAQKYSGAALSSADRAAIAGMIEEKSVPKLSQIGQNWSRLSAQHALIAYNYAFFAVDKLLEIKANTGIRNVLLNAGSFPAVQEELERALGF